VAFTAPHPEQVLLEANHRSAAIRVAPCQPALQGSWRRISANPHPAIWRASRLFFTIPATFRSSTATVPYPAASRVACLCWWSRRWSATRP